MMLMVLETVAEARCHVAAQKKQGKRIGLVPTMGALHEGHLSLIRRARQSCDKVIVSIFVNPTQFGPNEDYAAYPRTWHKDLALAEAAGASAVLHPSVQEMYPEGWGSWITVEEVPDKLCGKSRPTHFRGVATVVAKLLNIVQPEQAFFGQKDAQQVVLLQKMVRDLNLPVEIIMAPIVREADGLALSSRNVYLNGEERRAALVLSQSLAKAAELAGCGETDIEVIRRAVLCHIESEPLAVPDYVEIYSFPGLKDITKLDQTAIVAVAVKFGKTRLIDNCILEPVREK